MPPNALRIRWRNVPVRWRNDAAWTVEDDRRGAAEGPAHGARAGAGPGAAGGGAREGVPLAPALTEPVVAFRAWRVLDDRLLSPYIPCRWEGRVMHAMCYPANRALTFGRGWLAAAHQSPHPDCKCGIYAYHRPGVQQYFGEWEWVEGIVSVWGRIEAHADGLRAEHARVEAVTGRPAIAAHLGVEQVDRAELRAVAARYGAPLPATLLPESQAIGSASSP